MIIDELFESPQQCPECGGISFSDLILAEKKDACYHKVKASAKVWPSAYASGRLVQCRKKGAANYGNKSEGVTEGMFGPVVFSGTGNNGSTYEIIQSGPTDFMIHANGKHIDTYSSLQRAMSVLKNEVPGLEQGVAAGLSEMDKSQTPPGRDGSNDEGGKKEYPAKIITPKKAVKDGVKMLNKVLNKKQGMAENANAVDINQIASQMKFLPTTKLAKQYKFVKDGAPGQMPPMTYTVSSQEQPVVTVTSDGKETQNVATPNDVIMSGPSRENYVVKAAKFPKLYQGTMGGPVIPEQSPRLVALYVGKMPVTFTAPWGESMILKPGDYLVKDGDAGYYRIAKVEYDQTYNKPGSNGQQGMAEGVMYGAENLHVGDDVVISGDVELNGATGVIDSFGQDKRFVVVDLYNHGRHSFHSSDVSANDYENDEHDDDVLDEKSVSQAQFRTMAGAAHNPEFARKVGISQDVAQEFNQADKKSNYKKLPARATEGEQQPGADYRDPKEVDYDAIDHDKSVARLKHLAGLGPMKTVYDPAKRQYRNMPTAVQPKK